MNFYEQLLAYKAKNKLSWRFIGVLLNKEEATIRIAVKRQSLTELEKKELEKKFFLKREDDLPSENSNIGRKLTDKKILEVIEVILLHEEELLENKRFANWRNKIWKEGRNFGATEMKVKLIEKGLIKDQKG